MRLRRLLAAAFGGLALSCAAGQHDPSPPVPTGTRPDSASAPAAHDAPGDDVWSDDVEADAVEDVALPAPGDPAELAIGYSHSCARTFSGLVRCWGRNINGYIGDGTTTPRATPTAALLSNVASVAAGHYKTCAVSKTGDLWCWGSLYFGQAGDGTMTASPWPAAVPRLIPGLTDVVSAGGGSHTCAFLADGSVWCWGFNPHGEVGYVTTEPCPGTDGFTCSTVPRRVEGLEVTREVAFGPNHTCARSEGGSVRCWGQNTDGQLGDGTTASSHVPRRVLGLDDAIQISLGSNVSCALRATGDVVTWGARYVKSPLFHAPEKVTSPALVAGFSGPVASVHCAGRANCARMADGTVQCWGVNNPGNLGNPGLTEPVVTTPTTVPGLTDVTSLAVGGRACALRNDSTIWCWGAEPIGDGTWSAYAPAPTKVAW